MPTIEVRHENGDRFSIDVRGHRLLIDQPVVDGGTDEAPTPTELFVASLTGCVAFYVRRYLSRHGVSADGLSVTASFTMAAGPPRVGAIALVITVPTGLPADRRGALLAVARHCTVHNTLDVPPRITVDLADVEYTAA